MKSLCVAYTLWLFGGLFGLHHFYLKRDRHALVWAITWGGYLIGWLRDFTRLPDYVRAANRNTEFIHKLQLKQQLRAKPKSSLTRILGELVIGFSFGVLWRTIFPAENYDHLPILSTLLRILIPIPIALSIHLVGNIGEEKMSLSGSLFWSYAGLPFYWSDESRMLWGAVVCVVGSNWKAKSWRTILSNQREERSSCGGVAGRAAKLMLISGFVWGIWLHGAMYNVHITTDDGERVNLKEFFANFFESRAWQELSATMNKLYNTWQHQGFAYIWNEFLKAADPLGEDKAYDSLRLSKSVTLEEARTHCRKLTAKHHPDRFQDPAEKAEHEAKFTLLRQSCDIVMTRIKRRSNRSGKKSNRNSPFHEGHDEM